VSPVITYKHVQNGKIKDNAQLKNASISRPFSLLLQRDLNGSGFEVHAELEAYN
jgi:hypothetical protein